MPTSEMKTVAAATPNATGGVVVALTDRSVEIDPDRERCDIDYSTAAMPPSIVRPQHPDRPGV